MTAISAFSFDEAVQINENIKKVIRISERISLTALNSIFVARAAGVQSQGFRLISVDMRRFSAQLQTVMNTLRLDIFSLIQHTAYRQKLLRRRNQLHKAEQSLAGRRHLHQALDNADQELLAGLQRIQSTIRRIAEQVGQSRHLCKIGGAVARMAKIEAAYSSGHMRQLTQVSEEIEAAIQAIIDILEALHTQLRNQQS